MTDVVLAVDVGGTTVTAGLVTATGEVLWSVEAATVRTDRLRDPGLQQLAGIVRQSGRRQPTTVMRCAP